jgi:hypothetical protein
MHLFIRAAATFLLASLALLGTIVGPRVASAAPGIVGHVYINENTAGANTIGAFDRFADGSLAPSHGSPFAAGGAGTGTVIGSQGSL